MTDKSPPAPAPAAGVDVEAIERLYAEATPGVWVEGLECIYVDVPEMPGRSFDEAPEFPDTRVFAGCGQNDAHYVVALHRALPALAAEIRALRLALVNAGGCTFAEFAKLAATIELERDSLRAEVERLRERAVVADQLLAGVCEMRSCWSRYRAVERENRMGKMMKSATERAMGLTPHRRHERIVGRRAPETPTALDDRFRFMKAAAWTLRWPDGHGLRCVPIEGGRMSGWFLEERRHETWGPWREKGAAAARMFGTPVEAFDAARAFVEERCRGR